MKITFKLYASLTSLLPAHAVRNIVTIDIQPDTTINSIVDEYQIPRKLAHLVLVNGVYVAKEDRDLKAQLKEGDVLAIWPPVAGG